MNEHRQEAAVRAILESAGGVMRTGEILRAGVHPRDLYALRDAGVLVQVSRGVYRLANLPPMAEPDLLTVAARVPKAVVALISALHFHGLTTHIPHVVSVALPKGTARPRLDWPPLQVHWFSGPMYSTGIGIHDRDGVDLRVYSPAKSVVDAFRFRGRLGAHVAVEGLRAGLEESRFSPAEVFQIATVCRVDNVVRPYLEALQ